MSMQSMWGNAMGEVIGRCVSSEMSIEILEESKEFIPRENLARYMAALNRAKYILSRQKPIKPTEDGCCGHCGQFLHAGMTYCCNCGREIMRDV